MQQNYGYFEEDQLPNFGNAALWRRILTYIRPQRRGVTLAILLSLTVIGTNLALPHVMRLAIDNYIMNGHLTVGQRSQGLSHLALIFIGLITTSFVANFFQVTVLEWTGQTIMHHLRQQLFHHLIYLDLTFFNNTPAGRLITRLTNDIQNMHEMFTSVIITLFNDILQLAGILVILYLMNWKLALLMSLFLPLLTLHSITFSKMARSAFRKIRTQVAVINSFLQESLGGISLIQHFLQEADTEKKFKHQNQLLRLQTLTQIKIFGVFLPTIEVLNSLAIAIIIWFGGKDVLTGHITIGELAAFLSYMRLFFKPVRDIAQKYSIVQSAIASAEKIFQLLDQKSTLRTSTGLRPEIKGAICFREVKFSYKNSGTIIKNLNLDIAPGESLAIVGPTGAGKTSIINLLERLYDPEAGWITIDGVDLRDFETHWLRSQIGLVMQDVFIMPGTLRDNLTFGGILDNDKKIEDILQRSQLTKVVEDLPQGLDTVIGEGGYELAAGQKQLLALGRVMVRDPAILILDEATANIDSITEGLLKKAITATLSNRTSIVIAHRLSTIRHTKRIVVLEEGGITEQGSYNELQAANGLFARLIRLQQIE